MSPYSTTSPLLAVPAGLKLATLQVYTWLKARCSCSWLITLLLGLRLSFNLACVAKTSSCCRSCKSCAQSSLRIQNSYPTVLNVLEEYFFTCLCFLSWQKHDGREDNFFWWSWKWQSQWNLLWARSCHPADTTHLKNWSTACCTWPCGMDTIEVACTSSTMWTTESKTWRNAINKRQQKTGACMPKLNQGKSKNKQELNFGNKAKIISTFDQETFDSARSIQHVVLGLWLSLPQEGLANMLPFASALGQILP